MSTDRSIQSAYDRIAKDYADLNAVVPENLVPLMQRMAGHVGPSGIVGDIGCGHGRDTAWFTAAGVRVIGVDLSAGMLAVARSFTSAPLAQMDMQRLGMADGVLDGVSGASRRSSTSRSASPQLRSAKSAERFVPMACSFSACKKAMVRNCDSTSASGWNGTSPAIGATR